MSRITSTERWSKPYYGVQHLGTLSTSKRWCTVEDRDGFALLFRFVPDARTAWRDVWLGGAVTAVLLNGGQWAISQYLAKAAVGSPYGAAGSVVVLLVWVYYSAVIVFVGAEFTQQWAVQRGRGTVPDPHAKRGNPATPKVAASGANARH